MEAKTASNLKPIAANSLDFHILSSKRDNTLLYVNTLKFHHLVDSSLIMKKVWPKFFL